MPSAVLVIQDGSTKLVNIKNQDGITKILDMVPDFVNKFTSKNKEVDDASENVVDDASNHVEPKEAEAKTAAEKELEEFLKKSVDANE